MSASPHIRVSSSDYCADFAAIGAKSLDRPSWASRLALFLSYYVRLEPYDEARRRLGISRGTMNYWMSAIAKAAGQAMLEAGLWPPGRYLR
ncbi:MAG TPA: hypothetical protein VGS20_10935 [Candidatus Acidoferrales bacterium]|nr:hypothetical protein [Candidatus Acidoferrales bacterium]